MEASRIEIYEAIGQFLRSELTSLAAELEAAKEWPGYRPALDAVLEKLEPAVKAFEELLAALQRLHELRVAGPWGTTRSVITLRQLRL